MKKRAFIISLMTVLFLINLVSASIRINEVELNPYDGNSEWVELYSDQAMNLDGWKIIEKKNRTKVINGDIQNYLVIELDNQFLDNENEFIMLFNKISLVYKTPVLNDSLADSKTWNYCNSNWSFSDFSPGTLNLCPVQNQTIPKNETGPKPEIILGLDWNGDEIINGRDFDIEVSAFNLENKRYDVKIYIYGSDNKIISDTYYEDYDWIYSDTYVNHFFRGPGNKTDTLGMRIKERYRNFSGNAKIAAKIKEVYSSNIKAEKESNINIRAEGTEIQQPATNIEDQTESSNSVTGEVIKLGSQENATATSSKSNNFVFYFIFGFIVLIVIFLILLVIRILR